MRSAARKFRSGGVLMKMLLASAAVACHGRAWRVPLQAQAAAPKPAPAAGRRSQQHPARRLDRPVRRRSAVGQGQAALFPRRSSSRSTSSAARSTRSPTIRRRRPSPTRSRRCEKAGQRLDRVETDVRRDDRQHVDARISGARQGMVAQAVGRVRRDHAQPEALPADQGALRAARQRSASTPSRCAC